MPLNDKDFIINVGPQGTFNKSGKFQTLPEDIDRMFERFEANANLKKIALYFHGGLVGESAGLETARKVAPSLTHGDECMPVCFVWETGLLETIGSNLTKIGETKLFNKLLKVLLKKVGQKIGFDTPQGRGVAGPMLTDAEVEAELSKEAPFSDFERQASSPHARGAAGLENLAQNTSFLEADLKNELRNMIEGDPEFVSAIQQTKLTVDGTGNSTGSRGIVTVISFVSHVAKIAFRVISRFIEKRDHDFFPTVVEEILREFYIAELGAWVWKAMKDKADSMWENNTGRSGLNQFAARYFLDKLAALKAAKPALEINVIGHSAGSIATCHLLKHTASLANSFAYKQILFMAPACRVDLFEKEILNNPSRYDTIRIFTMSDEFECKDRMIPFFYTHSLLYLISGILEDEGDSFDAFILGLERHIRFLAPYDVENLKAVHTYLYDTGFNRKCFSVTAVGTGDGLGTTSLSHGGFDDDETTMKSISFLLK
jgi:hypothetical protein